MSRQSFALGPCLVLVGVLSGAPAALGQLLSDPDYGQFGESILSEDPGPADPSVTPEQETPDSDEPTPADSPEADAKAADAGDDNNAEEIAKPFSANYSAQPVGTYDTRLGGWLPDCNQTSTCWMQELEPPQGMIECTCNGVQPGKRIRVWRSFVKPTDPSINQRCVVCVKEPCMGYEIVEEEYRAVLYRCFESSEPFKRGGCEGGQWYEEQGDKRIRKLHSCEVKVPVKYQKPVIKYRDVYYYIQCDHSR